MHDEIIDILSKHLQEQELLVIEERSKKPKRLEKIISVRIKLPVKMYSSVRALLDFLPYVQLNRISLGESWIESEEMAYCYIKINSTYALGIQSAVSEINELLESVREIKGIVPEGRMELQGTVMKLKVELSPYGPSMKMLVQLQNKGTIWGTVPKSISHVQERQQIQFTATVTRSKDASHGFFSRPSKSKIIT